MSQLNIFPGLASAVAKERACLSEISGAVKQQSLGLLVTVFAAARKSLRMKSTQKNTGQKQWILNDTMSCLSWFSSFEHSHYNKRVNLHFCLVSLNWTSDTHHAPDRRSLCRHCMSLGRKGSSWHWQRSPTYSRLSGSHPSLILPPSFLAHCLGLLSAQLLRCFGSPSLLVVC